MKRTDACILSAWDACQPAKLEAFQPCIDCPSFATYHYVVPTDGGECQFVAFTDWSTDLLGGCRVLQDECSAVTSPPTEPLLCP